MPYVERCDGCRREWYSYFLIVAKRAFFPHRIRAMGDIRTANERIPSKINIFCIPIPSSHGLSAKEMTTARALRTNTTATRASPMIYLFCVSHFERSYVISTSYDMTYIWVAILQICKRNIETKCESACEYKHACRQHPPMCKLRNSISFKCRGSIIWREGD